MSEDLELAGMFDNYSGIAVANLGTKTFKVVPLITKTLC